MGDTKLWTALHTFTIEGVEEPGNGNPSNVLAKILSAHTILAGDGVVYFLTVTVPHGWVNLNVEVTGSDNYKAANLRVVSQGTVAFMPLVWMVKSIEANDLNVCTA